jgi:hypothetical protein
VVHLLISTDALNVLFAVIAYPVAYGTGAEARVTTLRAYAAVGCVAVETKTIGFLQFVV